MGGDASKSITVEDLLPLTNKRTLTEVEDREEEASSTHQEPISKNKMPFYTMKAKRRAQKAQARREGITNVPPELAEARQIKHSAVMALEAVRREIRAELMRKREKEPPVPMEVTDAMSKSQKKRKIRKRERQEVKLALEEKIRTDVEIRKLNQEFKDARKKCRDLGKKKREMYSAAKEAQSGRQYPVREDPGFAMFQRGPNLDNHLFADTRHHANRPATVLPLPMTRSTVTQSGTSRWSK